MTYFQMNGQQRKGSYWFAPSLGSDSPQLPVEPRKRRRLSRLSTSGHGQLRRQQGRQAAQIDREHGQGEHIADFAATAQLDLADRAAVLLAVAEDRFDQCANEPATLRSRSRIFPTAGVGT